MSRLIYLKHRTCTHKLGYIHTCEEKKEKFKSPPLPLSWMEIAVNILQIPRPCLWKTSVLMFHRQYNSNETSGGVDICFHANFTALSTTGGFALPAPRCQRLFKSQHTLVLSELVDTGNPHLMLFRFMSLSFISVFSFYRLHSLFFHISLFVIYHVTISVCEIRLRYCNIYFMMGFFPSLCVFFSFWRVHFRCFSTDGSVWECTLWWVDARSDNKPHQPTHWAVHLHWKPLKCH